MNGTKTKKKTPFWKAAPLLICIVVIGAIFVAWSAAKNDTKAPAKKPLPPPLQTELSAQPTQTLSSEEVTETTPVETEPAIKEFCQVDEHYFDDALFLGNSRTKWFGYYQPLGEATYYGVDMMTIYDVLDNTDTVNGYTGVYDVLSAKHYGKVYLCFGINECGFSNESFMESYHELIDVIRYYQPDALIFVQSIMYTTRARAEKEPVFNTSVISNKNEAISELDNGIDIFYLDVNEFVDDGTGYMKAEYSGDGAHLYPEYYELYRDYILAHGIVDKDHPAIAPKN